MSLWKRLFGASDAAEVPNVAAREEYKGFTIHAEPYAADGQFQVAGTITKTVDGTERSQRFVRADRFATLDDATQIALMKGRQMIDQMGDRLFS